MKNSAVLLSFLIFLVSDIAFAKCPTIGYEISGKIIDENGPVSGISVYIFLNDPQQDLFRKIGPKNRDYFTTDQNGEFNGILYFYPMSPSKDEKYLYSCDAELKRIEVIPIANSYKTMRRIFKADDLKIEKDNKLKLKSIRMIKS